jgi:uncharacterized protein (DUF2141 family)
MKALFLAALTTAALSAGAAQAGELHLTLEGIQPRGGQVLVSVQSKEQFMLPTSTAGGIVAGDTTGSASLVLPAPDGEYAVLVLHDADGSFDMKVDERGVPLEGVASAHGQLTGFPVFDVVKVRVEGQTSLTARMTYLH